MGESKFHHLNWIEVRPEHISKMGESKFHHLNLSDVLFRADKGITGFINGHEYVDLGLSVKWATCNVGASSPSDYGDYFAWGETKTKDRYKERNSLTRERKLGSIAGNPQYDAARANWGGTWRMPTKEEIEELVRECTWNWVVKDAHNGCEVTGFNGRSIFLPAAGWRGSPLNFVGRYGPYWSATPYEDDALSAYYLYLRKGYFGRAWTSRYYGHSVRPVSD